MITKNETACAIMSHRKIPSSTQEVAAGTPVAGANPGQEAAWGPSGTHEKPTGLGIVNFRTREMTIIGQMPSGSDLWHVSGSPDGRWAVGDSKRAFAAFFTLFLLTAFNLTAYLPHFT